MSFDIRRERMARGLTLPQLADEVELPYHVVRRAERGERIREGSAKLLADFFRVSVFDVLPEEAAA